uniref:2-amino-4-hydroxy-6-hydroxymethyldihydropteridine pyrophosphokinase n=1 Tax=Candidatus Kentrum sp. FM TaxID=2126340 RepID=A0A450SC58_9GAMM|nr:MAG: 2-amino-4-hydroxy-6-hydroxymethyldihydropteridinediphosphokinase [Candidatus Kentron sp. FM]VFJ49877.1 MAG: 2-amino-4-hydroxy-6-hydroxymethyldihydropteridinediphosphokinase [Candidatus Kentron sp. FM]VFK16766.1 MAG: 2-amino-4-hydroxy-6-hydroxymethyldihydropteridinediphosphokinase [Candidatus Kentron sp. FM]
MQQFTRQHHHVIAYIGVGANLGDPIATVRAALTALRELPKTKPSSVSNLYRTSPLGPPDQPDFINAVAAIHTGLSPFVLLSSLQSIEHRYGRIRDHVRWGPRTLDLDLLLYGDSRITGEVLTVPHAGLNERAFVLVPLHEIAPDLVIPGYESVKKLLEGVADQRVELLEQRKYT